MFLRALVHIPFWCVGILTAFGQPLTIETAASANGELFATRLFENAQAGTHHLYSGPAYMPYSPIGDEHPYFLRNELFFGKVKLDGVWYTDVPMKFDLASSLVVVPYYFGGTPIALVNTFVDAFVLDGHYFVHIRTQPVPEAPSPGFYELLHDGPVPLYIEHRKVFTESLVDLEIKRDFRAESRYFIIVNGQQRNVKNRRTMLKLLPQQKQVLRAYLREYPLATYKQMLQHLESR